MFTRCVLSWVFAFLLTTLSGDGSAATPSPTTTPTRKHQRKPSLTDLLPPPVTSVFHIHGQIVDEDGTPLDIGLFYTEAHFVSVTQNKYGGGIAATPNGGFDFTTKPCEGVSIDFGKQGYLHEHIGFSAMADVPDPLRIVMHKVVPISRPVLPNGRVSGKYITEGRYMRPAAAYKTIELDLNPDFTLTTTMTMPDGTTKYDGEGTWKQLDTTSLKWSVKWRGEIPAALAQATGEGPLTIMDDGRLFTRYDGPEYTFVAPSGLIAAGDKAPANAVGKYVASGQYMPPYIVYDSIELELKSDFSLAATMTLPHQKTYKGTGSWAWPEPRHGHIFITVKWENGAPLPRQHPLDGDVLDVHDDDIHRLGQHYGGPDFVRVESTPPPAPANLVGTFIAKSAEQMRLPRPPYFTLEVFLNADYKIAAIMTMPDQKTNYEGTGTWQRSGPFLIEPTITWQANTLPLSRQFNRGQEAWSILDEGQRIATDYGVLYRNH